MAGVIGGVNHSISTLNRINSAAQKTSRTISTGSNYPSAYYGGAAYSILQRMNSHTGMATQSVQNTQNAGAMLRIAAGATSNTIDILRNIRQSIVNAANGVNSDADRAAIQKDINQSVQQIDDNAHAEYNGMNLLNGSRNGIMVAGVTGYENVPLGNMTSQALGLTDEQGNVTINVSNDESIQNALEAVDGAMEYAQGVNENLQSTLQGGDILDYSLDEATTQGAYLQRLEYQANNYTTMEESTQAAENTLGSADIARRITDLRSEEVQKRLAMEMANVFNRSQANALELLR